MYGIIYLRLPALLSLACLCLLFGCSKDILLKDADPDKKWSCNTAADNALANQDLETAIATHEDLLEKEPENGLAMYHLGFAYGLIGDRGKEIQYYKMAVNHGFYQNGIFFNLGMAYGEQNLTVKAISTFKRGIQENPDNSDNHFGLALAYQQSGYSGPAEKEFLKAIKLNPGIIEARIHLSALYADKGKKDKAKEQLNNVLKIDPGNSLAQELLRDLK